MKTPVTLTRFVFPTIIFHTMHQIAISIDEMRRICKFLMCLRLEKLNQFDTETISTEAMKTSTSLEKWIFLRNKLCFCYYCISYRKGLFTRKLALSFGDFGSHLTNLVCENYKNEIKALQTYLEICVQKLTKNDKKCLECVWMLFWIY